MSVGDRRNVRPVWKPGSLLVRGLVIMVCVAFAGLPAGRMAGAVAAAPGGTLIMADDQSDVRTLDPGSEFEFAAAFVDLNSYDTLVVPKGANDFTSFVPHLAKSVKVSADGL